MGEKKPIGVGNSLETAKSEQPIGNQNASITLQWSNVNIKAMEKSFWSVITNLFQLLNSEDMHQKQGPRGVTLDCSAEFKIWFLAKIAPLYWINAEGKNTLKNKVFLPGNWLVVQELVSACLSETDTSEEKLKFVIWGCVLLTKVWCVNLSTFNPFLDYINKTIGNSPHVGGRLLDKFVKIETSSSELLEVCLRYGDQEAYSPERPVFECFLQFLAATVSRIHETNSANLLPQLKGRIYSKFHKRRMEELNAYGLENFSKMFTVLVLSEKKVELTQKFCSCISSMQLENKSVIFQKAAIGCLFTMVLACLHVDVSIKDVACKLNSVIYSLTKTLKSTRTDKNANQQTWNLISYYLNNVEECFDYGKTSVDQTLLINETYSYLIRFSSENQRQKIYSHVKHILSSALAQHSPQLVCKMLHKNVYKSLETQYQGKPCEQLAEVIAGFTLFSLQSPDSGGEDFTFSELVNTYVFTSTNPSKYAYLNHLLSSSHAIQMLEQTNNSDRLVKTWINSVLMDSLKMSTIFELTKSMLNVGQVQRFVSTRICESVSDLKLIFKQFLLGLGTHFLALTAPTELLTCRKMIKHCFGDIVKISEPIIYNNSSDRSLTLAYHIAGNLVRCCPKAIYSKTSPTCLLPSLLDLFALPLRSGKKTLAANVSSTANDHLHLFICGLSHLDFRKDEFVLRKIKEIFQKYFVQSCLQSYEQQHRKNPFLPSLESDCVKYPNSFISDYRHMVLQHIKVSFLYLPQPPKQLASVLNFLLVLLRASIPSEEVVWSMELLSGNILSCVLACDKVECKGELVAVRKLAMSILKIMFTSNQSEKITTLLRNFARDNMYHYQNVLFQSFQSVAIVTSRVVMKSVLSELEKLIHESELKRGVGQDLTLRLALRELSDFVETKTL